MSCKFAESGWESGGKAAPDPKIRRRGINHQPKYYTTKTAENQ
jgi:hypothetical protein